jgi:UDP-N-acetyl-D-mannosaminuronic acid dehydrogenase
MNDKFKQEEVCVVGLGYVGLTLGVAFANSGLRVTGIEISKEILSSLNQKKAHFSENGLDNQIRKVIDNKSFSFAEEIEPKNSLSIYIITVGTPLDKSGIPKTDSIINATNQVASVMNDDCLIILRSTVQIGATRNIVKPILDKTNLKYSLAMCPERTLEGNAIRELSTLPQIIGSNNLETSNKCVRLFNNITSKTNIVSSWETAEIIKLSDNAYRDVSFAFGNEVAKVCAAFNVDCYEVIENGKADYPRTDIALPGLVGGPCLEKDPHIYNFSALQKNIKMEIIAAARKINEELPKDIARIIFSSSIASRTNRLKILLCGLAFKGVPETDDLRGSMGLKFLEIIENIDRNDEIFLFDFEVPSNKLTKIGKVVENIENDEKQFDLIVILNNHQNFIKIGLSNLSQKLHKSGLIFDFWNNFYYEQKKIKELNKYYSLGNLGELKDV